MTERAVALYEQELLRTRWRRWRRRVGLEAVNDDLFALRGEPQPSDSLAGRILILPRDPECAFIDFDEAFRDWYANPCPDPVTGGSTNFGNATRTLSNCAVLYESDYRDESNPWLGFFALPSLGCARRGTFGTLRPRGRQLKVLPLGGSSGSVLGGRDSLLGIRRALEARRAVRDFAGPPRHAGRPTRRGR